MLFRYGPASDRGGFELRVADLEIAAGEKVALYGRSGCGKSTLLNLFAAVFAPSAGSLQVVGAQVSSLTEAQRRAHRIQNVGFVFQDFPLVDYLSVGENVLFPYRLHRALRQDAAVEHHAEHLLENLGLAGKRKRRPTELSQGERQRVAIARALVVRPPLVLADEPTAGLDPEQSRAVLGLVEEVCEDNNATLVWVTHDPTLLERFERALEVPSLFAASPSKPGDAGVS